jgi:hypothetical protein
MDFYAVDPRTGHITPLHRVLIIGVPDQLNAKPQVLAGFQCTEHGYAEVCPQQLTPDFKRAARKFIDKALAENNTVVVKSV